MKTTRKSMHFPGIRGLAAEYTAIFFAIGLLAAAPLAARGEGKIKLERPEQRQYLVDQANFLDDPQAEEIQLICEKLLNDRATPLTLVSIDRMASHGGEGMTIETFAATLFDEWGIGHPRVGNRDWDTGILLLLSREDRRARIEFGAGWRHRYDSAAEQIMNTEIVPRCKQGDFAGAMLAATRRLDALVREALPNPNQVPANQPPSIKEPPSYSKSTFDHLLRHPANWTLWQWIGIVLGSILLGLSLYSILTEGTRGWGFSFWAFVFRILMWIAIFVILRGNRGRHRSSGFFGGGGGGGGGSFGGGSFGGGRSGGGGASGGW